MAALKDGERRFEESLCDPIEFRPTINEAASTPQYMMMTGIVQLADVKNKNNRVYPRTVWESVLGANSDFMRRLASNAVVGCLGHPESGKTDPRLISHVMTRVWTEDKFLPECVVCAANGKPHSHIMGEEKVLNTPDGVVMQQLARAGIPIGMSSRGKGSVIGSSTDEQIVAEDFKLDTFDFVLDPSTHGAWARQVTEGVLQACANGVCCTTTEAELAGYRRILSEAQQHGDKSVSGHAQQLIEAIDSRLLGESPAAKAIEEASARLLEAVREGRPIIGASARRVAPAHQRGRVEESGMNINDPEVKALIEAEVKSQTSAQSRRLAEALAERDSIKAELSGKLSESEANLAASKTALQEALSQVRQANFQLTVMTESLADGATGAGTPVAYEFDDQFTESQALHAARLVIDELAEENDGLREENLGLLSRNEAAEKFVESVRQRESRKAVVEHTNKLLAKAGFTEAAAADARLILNESTSTEEVNRKFAVVARLRPGGTPQLTEAQRAAAARGAGLPLGSRALTEDTELLQPHQPAGALGEGTGDDATYFTNLSEADQEMVGMSNLLQERLRTGRLPLDS